MTGATPTPRVKISMPPLQSVSIESLVDFALMVEDLRKRGQMRKKGRKASPRADAIWQRSPRRAQALKALVYEAAKDAYELTKQRSGEDFRRALGWHLWDHYLRVMRGAGRPRRGLLYSSVSSKRWSGRPPILSLTEEAEFVHAVFQIKSGVYAKQELFKSIDAFRIEFAKHPEWRADIAKIPDVVALRIFRDYTKTPVPLQTLRQRYSRAKKAHSQKGKWG